VSGIKTNKVLIGKPIGSSFSLDTSGNINIDGSIYLYGVPISFSGDVTQLYVDGSLAFRDSSIEALFIENDIQDSSISDLQSRINIIDGSIIFIDSSVNQLFGQKADLTYIDGSLLFRDASISLLYEWQISQDSSINDLRNKNISQDTSINNLRTYIDGSLLNIDSSINQLFSQKSDLSYVNETFLRESSLGPQFYFQDGSLFVIDVSGITPDVTKTYVDGSLSLRDASISNNSQRIDIIDGSIIFLDSSINQLFSQKSDLLYVDGSLVLRDSSIQWIADNTYTKTYIDGSLAIRDASISQLFTITNNFDISIGNLDILTQIHEVSLGNLSLSQLEQDLSINALFIENDIQDASITNLRNRIDVIDTSIIFLDGSVNQLFVQKADLSYVDGSLNQLRIDVDASFQSIELGLVDFLTPIDGVASDVSALIVYSNRQMLAGQPIYLHDPSDLGFVFNSLTTTNNYNYLPWIGINGGTSAPRVKLSGASTVFSTSGIRGIELYIEPTANVEIIGLSEHARVDLAEIRFGISASPNSLTIRAVNMSVGRIEGQTGNSNLNIKDRSFIQCQSLNEIENVNIEGGSFLFANWVRINTLINIGWDGSTKTTAPAIVNLAKPQNITTGKINIIGDNNIITASTFPIDISTGATNNTIIGQNNTIIDNGINTIILENLVGISYVDGSLNAIRSEYIPDVSLGDNFYWDSSNYLNVQELKGTIFPVSPSEGDQFYRTDMQLLFSYDSSRGKYLSVARPEYVFGRTSLTGAAAGYLTMSGATHSSTEGLRMPYNGTVLSATANNTNTVTRDLQIRLNNSPIATLSLAAQKSNSLLQINQNFSAGDLIQIYSPANVGNTLSNVTFTLEVAWR
jgi:hypothetical protein